MERLNDALVAKMAYNRMQAEQVQVECEFLNEVANRMQHQDRIQIYEYILAVYEQEVKDRPFSRLTVTSFALLNTPPRW